MKENGRHIKMKKYEIDEGEWQTYQDEEIRLEVGQTIYAKGIDKYGNETRTVSSYTATVPSDAIGPNAYDGNESTYFQGNGTYYMDIDSSMRGKEVKINIQSTSGLYCWGYIYIVLEDATEQLKVSVGNRTSFNSVIEIPENATKIKYITQTNVRLYEIQPSN